MPPEKQKYFILSQAGAERVSPHGLACATHYSFPALQCKHQGALSSVGEAQSCLGLPPPTIYTGAKIFPNTLITSSTCI